MPTGDGQVPAIYTYFGQFVDHDITLESTSFTTAKLLAPTLAPLAVGKVTKLNGTQAPLKRPPARATTTTCPGSRATPTCSGTGRPASATPATTRT